MSTPSLPDGLLLTFYGDDFTGSSAAMEVTAFAGLPTCQGWRAACAWRDCRNEESYVRVIQRPLLARLRRHAMSVSRSALYR